MSLPNALRALPTTWFRFRNEADRDKYGDRWFKYDESSVLLRSARELISLETDLGMPLVAVMNGFRESTVLGDTAVAWIAMRDVDPAIAGEFDKFDPVSMMIEWVQENPEPEGKSDPPANTPEPVDSDSQMDTDSDTGTSVQTATVILPVMPISGSSS